MIGAGKVKQSFHSMPYPPIKVVKTDQIRRLEARTISG